MFPAGNPHSQGDSRISCTAGIGMLPDGFPQSQHDLRVTFITGAGVFHAEDPHSQGDSHISCITGGAGLFHDNHSRYIFYYRSWHASCRGSSLSG